MLKKLSKIKGSKQLSKVYQKDIVGGFGLIRTVENCGPGANGLRCETGMPHCPLGTCYGFNCIPDTNG